MGADFLRKMTWLGRDRVRAYLRIVALLNVAMLVVLALTSRGGVDANGFLLGSDFLSFWTAGHMLHHQADVYDGAAHIAAQRDFFASAEGYTAFFYPPSFLPFCWPLGYFGYFPALALWLAATGAVYLTAAGMWRREAGLAAPLWLLFAAFPAAATVVTHGQTSFLLAGLLGLGMLLVPRRPLLAGILIGLATIKPQFGPLIPLVLLLTREWKAMASAAVTALALALFSALAFGPELAGEWLAASAHAQDAMANGAVGYGKMMSAFAAAKLLGAPTAAAYALQAAVSLGVAFLLGRAAWGRRYSAGLAALTLAGAPLVTPFVLDYDLVLLAFPLLWMVGHGLREGFEDWQKLAVLLAFIAPVFARPLGMFAGVPIMPAVLGFLFWAMLRALPRRGCKRRAAEVSG